MDMTGQYRIPAPREVVWEALNDPEVLKACIPGCESLTRTSDTTMTAKVVAKVGPVRATFNGEVTLSNINPPESYTISGEGKGGAAGFARGGADVKLTEDGEETVLDYAVKATVGGKLAQVGARLIDSTAKKMADEFFSSFVAKVAAPSPVAPPAGVLTPQEAIEEGTTNAEEAGELAEEIEERVEVAAGRGAFGGPVVWGLAALIVVILAIMLMT